METGCFGVLGSLMLASAAAAQPLEVVVSQPPVAGIGGQASQQLTGAQTIEPSRVLADDFVADRDAVAERIRLYAYPTGNAYAIRLRLIELDAINNEIALLAEVSAGAGRVTIENSGDGASDKLTVYELVLASPVGLREGTRYGIEAVGLLTSPARGDESRAWRWAGAAGDGSDMLERTEAGLVRLGHPGVAFEVLGEVLASECLADVNQDGQLSPTDYNAWILAYNQRDPRADQNGDGAVTPADYNAWIINYSAGC